MREKMELGTISATLGNIGLNSEDYTYIPCIKI